MLFFQSNLWWQRAYMGREKELRLCKVKVSQQHTLPMPPPSPPDGTRHGPLKFAPPGMPKQAFPSLGRCFCKGSSRHPRAFSSSLSTQSHSHSRLWHYARFTPQRHGTAHRVRCFTQTQQHGRLPPQVVAPWNWFLSPQRAQKAGSTLGKALIRTSPRVHTEEYFCNVKMYFFVSCPYPIFTAVSLFLTNYLHPCGQPNYMPR